MIPGNLGARMTQLTDCYAFWRLRRAKVVMIIDGTTANLATFAVGWIPLPASEFTAATTMATMIDFPIVRLFSPTTSVMQQIYINPRDMNHNVNWLFTNSNSGADGFYSAGVFTFAALTGNTTNAPYYDYYIEVEVELKDPVDPALNPLSAIRRGPGIRDRLNWRKEEKDEKDEKSVFEIVDPPRPVLTRQTTRGFPRVESRR